MPQNLPLQGVSLPVRITRLSAGQLRAHTTLGQKMDAAVTPMGAAPQATKRPTTRSHSAQVLLDGLVMGRMDRSGPANLSLSLSSLSRGRSPAVLSIVVEAVGRANEGWRYDAKGLKSPAVTLHGGALHRSLTEFRV